MNAKEIVYTPSADEMPWCGGEIKCAAIHWSHLFSIRPTYDRRDRIIKAYEISWCCFGSVNLELVRIYREAMDKAIRIALQLERKYKGKEYK